MYNEHYRDTISDVVRLVWDAYRTAVSEDEIAWALAPNTVEDRQKAMRGEHNLRPYDFKSIISSKDNYNPFGDLVEGLARAQQWMVYEVFDNQNRFPSTHHLLKSEFCNRTMEKALEEAGTITTEEGDDEELILHLGRMRLRNSLLGGITGGARVAMYLAISNQRHQTIQTAGSATNRLSKVALEHMDDMERELGTHKEGEYGLMKTDSTLITHRGVQRENLKPYGLDRTPGCPSSAGISKDCREFLKDQGITPRGRVAWELGEYARERFLTQIEPHVRQYQDRLDPKFLELIGAETR